ncbi:hypothetical protein V1477_016778 [Vespula maculifrons]|uniref:Uncharacterized protein n=1 Tax=Vespula maculifrons TaxID=7453 RepID=A0ABD2B470_VESMC
MPSPLGPATKLNLETIMAPRVLVVGDDGQLRPKEEDQNDDDDDDDEKVKEEEKEEEEEGGTLLEWNVSVELKETEKKINNSNHNNGDNDVEDDDPPTLNIERTKSFKKFSNQIERERKRNNLHPITFHTFPLRGNSVYI